GAVAHVLRRGAVHPRCRPQDPAPPSRHRRLPGHVDESRRLGARAGFGRSVMLRTIVVPLDGTDFSARAIPVARAIARAGKADLRLVGVARPAPDPAPPPPPPPD